MAVKVNTELIADKIFHRKGQDWLLFLQNMRSVFKTDKETKGIMMDAKEFDELIAYIKEKTT